MLFTLGACLIIYVGKCVEFVDHYVDVVATDAVALAGDALSFIGTCNSVELTAADLTLLGVEMCCHGVDAGRVTH